jgi:hypothetical protein
MTATAGVNIAAQIPEMGLTRPDGEMPVQARGTSDFRGISSTEAGDFRANWQQLLTSVSTGEDARESAETPQQETGRNTWAGEVGTSNRSRPGSLDPNAQRASGVAGEGILSLPAVVDESHPMSSQSALTIDRHIALQSGNLQLPNEMHIRRGEHASRHGELKERAGVKSTDHPDSTPAANYSAAALIPATETVASPVPIPHESEIRVPFLSNPRSDAHSESLDSFASAALTRQGSEAIPPTHASGGTVQARAVAEPAAQPIPPHATSDEVLDPSTLTTQTRLAPSSVHTAVHAPDGSPVQNVALELSDTGSQAHFSSDFQSGSAPVSVRTEAIREATEAGHSKVRIQRHEAEPSSGARMQAQLRPSTQGPSVQLMASDTQRLGAVDIRNTSAMLTAGSRESVSIASPAPLGNANFAGRELFAALDADGTATSPAWVRTGTHQAEAGFQDPELGWVTVRAHTGANGVHAALVPGSIDAALSLGGHLSGLNAYLAEHHAAIQPVMVSAPEIRLGESPLEQGGYHGAAQGGSQEQRGAGADADSGTAAESPLHSVSVARQSAGLEPQVFAAHGSRYISVLA